jgi:hypothetical protein
MATTDPACDFAAFIAQRRGISEEEARELIRGWVAGFVPRAKPLDAQLDSAIHLDPRQASLATSDSLASAR